MRSCILGMLFFVATLTNAEVTIQSFDSDKLFVMARLSGTISLQDVRMIQKILDLKNNTQHFVLTVESSGGDWYSAILLGRVLRENDAAVWVGKQGCHSACVLVLAGAPRRTFFGPVGIHRPYSPDTSPRTYAEAQKRYRELEAATRAYLSDMNLPPSLFDAMVRVPSEEVRILTAEELSTFGLDKLDPVTQELNDATEARKYGLSKQEYLARKAQREKVCTPRYSASQSVEDVLRVVRDDLACRDAVMRGMR